MLLGVLKGLIHRAHVICDEKEDLLEELELLRNVFICNGYPDHLVSATLEETWSRETLKAVLRGVQQDVELMGMGGKEKDYDEVMRAPYVKGFSEGLQRKLRKVKIGFVAMKKETIYSNLCKLKQTVDFEDCKDVVYSVPCMKCDLRYLGETGQHFCERKKQHERDIKNRKGSNGFYEHSRKNEGHKPDWSRTVFVAREKHWRARKIKEAVMINAVNPTKNI